MKRINVTLPEEALRMMDRVASKGQRSRLIDDAVQQYIREIGRTESRKQLKEGAQKRADRDLDLVAGWFNVEEEAWASGKK